MRLQPSSTQRYLHESVQVRMSWAAPMRVSGVAGRANTSSMLVLSCAKHDMVLSKHFTIQPWGFCTQVLALHLSIWKPYAASLLAAARYVVGLRLPSLLAYTRIAAVQNHIWTSCCGSMQTSKGATACSRDPATKLLNTHRPATYW